MWYRDELPKCEGPALTVLLATPILALSVYMASRSVPRQLTTKPEVQYTQQYHELPIQNVRTGDFVYVQFGDFLLSPYQSFNLSSFISAYEHNHGAMPAGTLQHILESTAFPSEGSKRYVNAMDLEKLMGHIEQQGLPSFPLSEAERTRIMGPRQTYRGRT